MKEYRKFTVTNPKLVNLRNNLRELIYLSVRDRMNALSLIASRFEPYSEERKEVSNEISNLNVAYEFSSCKCGICQSLSKNMIKFIKQGVSYCVNCVKKDFFVDTFRECFKEDPPEIIW